MLELKKKEMGDVGKVDIIQRPLVEREDEAEEAEIKKKEPIPREVIVVLVLKCFSEMCYFQVDPYFPQFLIDREMN